MTTETLETAQASAITFDDLGISPQMARTLSEKGYVNPTPVQADVIPLVIQTEQDVIAQAKTGTGKTGAFSIPIIERMDYDSPTIQAIILAPTRELALQVGTELEVYKGRNPINIIPLCGGQSITDQIKQLRQNHLPAIVVGTPGRVLDHLKRKRLDLSNLNFFILDEVDEMLNVGFKEDIDDILSKTNEDKRTLILSATLPNEVLRLAKNYLNEHTIIRIKAEEQDTSNIVQGYYDVNSRDKFNLLCRVIDQAEEFYGMVFSNTKREADRIAEQLIAKGYNSECLHGDLSQHQRERALLKFKTHQCNILVVTDVASRGIDIKNLSHVINLSIPQTPEIYTHRVGRTGRAGASGHAFTFVQPSEFYKFKQTQKRIPYTLDKLDIPSDHDVQQQKKANLLSKISEVESNKKAKEIAKLILDDHDAFDAVAALLELGFKDIVTTAKHSDISKVNYSEGGGGRNGRGGNGHRRRRNGRGGGGGYGGGGSRGDGNRSGGGGRQRKRY